MILWLQRKLRSMVLRVEYYTEQWVIPNRHELCMLIENTDTPDFEAYEQGVDEAQARWGVYDSLIQEMKATGRFMKFKRDRSIKESDAT